MCNEIYSTRYPSAKKCGLDHGYSFIYFRVSSHPAS